MLGDGDGNLQPGTEYILGDSLKPISIAAADLDGDEDIDLVAISNYANELLRIAIVVVKFFIMIVREKESCNNKMDSARKKMRRRYPIMTSYSEFRYVVGSRRLRYT